MKYYIDIKLLGDTEITLGFIWQKIYAEIHLALVTHKDTENMVKVGLSFPHYMKVFPLGDTLRLLASTREELELLDIEDRLKKFSDYLLISEMKEVPTDIKSYATFSRKQFKSNPARLARRYAKRHNVTLEEALKVYEGVEGKETKLPYVNIKSSSTGQYLKIFIERREIEQGQLGKFNTFGLSKTSTVPIF